MTNFKLHKQNSEQLIVCFAGIANKMGVDNFEFEKTLLKLNMDYLIVKDISKRWYHHGINENIKTFNDLCLFIKQHMNDYKQTHFLGSSAGGHAAILYGINLNPNTIIAMCPQINVNPNYFHEKRWIQERSKITNIDNTDLSIFKNKILQNKNLKIAVSNKCYEDIKQLKLLDPNLNNLNIEYYDSKEHNVAKIIKSTVGLEKFISKTILEFEDK